MRGKLVGPASGSRADRVIGYSRGLPAGTDATGGVRPIPRRERPLGRTGREGMRGASGRERRAGTRGVGVQENHESGPSAAGVTRALGQERAPSRHCGSQAANDGRRAAHSSGDCRCDTSPLREGCVPRGTGLPSRNGPRATDDGRPRLYGGYRCSASLLRRRCGLSRHGGSRTERPRATGGGWRRLRAVTIAATPGPPLPACRPRSARSGRTGTRRTEARR